MKWLKFSLILILSSFVFLGIQAQNFLVRSVESGPPTLYRLNFTTTGTSFAVRFGTDINGTFMWYWSDGTIDSIENPTKSWGSAESREHFLWTLTTDSLIKMDWYIEDVECDISEFNKYTNLTYLRIRQCNYTSDISGLDSLVNLTDLELYGTPLVGDISGINTLVNLTYLGLSGTAVTGDISGINSLVNLTNLQMRGTIGITGDIGGINTMTNLTTFNAYLGNLSGNINGISSLTALTWVDLRGNEVTGDLASINTLVNLTTFYSTGNYTYTHTTLPDWEGSYLYIPSCGLDTAEVDSFLIDLDNATGSPGNGNLNIAGTNQARSSDSDAAKASLIIKGWGITVNE